MYQNLIFLFAVLHYFESKGEFVDVKITNRNKTPFPKFIELVLSNEQKVFRINLWKNEDLSDKIPVKIDGIDKNGQNDYNPDVEHYIGNTYNAVVSIRNLKDNKEIMGSFDNYGKTYEIRPIDSSDKHNDDNKNHIIQEIDKEILNTRYQSFNVPKRNPRLIKKLIKKRETTELNINIFYVEILFLLDHTIWEWAMERFETENDALKHIRYRFGHMMNGIVMAYSNIDFNSYNIIIKPFLKEIMITSNKEHSQYVISAITHHGSNFVNTTIDGDSLLNNLKKWLAENGKNWLDPDFLMHWTRYNLFGDNTTGYAPLAGICISGSSVSTIEDRGYRSWNTAAHELGHNLGSEHDGIGNSQDCDPNENYIMRPGGGYVKKENYKNSYIFSSCSVIAMKNVIYGNSFNGFPRVCLFNTVCHHDVSDEDLSQMPGEMFDLDRQCQIYFGEGSSKCSFDHVSDNCYAPFCQIDENNCKSLPYGSILEGTHCGDNKWCIHAECVEINEKYRPKFTISLSCKERLFFNNDRTVPIDCENYYDNCDNLVKAKQFICFTKDFSTRCCKACHEKGFYLSDNFTNMVTNTDASSTTTPTLTTSKYYTSPITTYRTSTTSPLTTNDFTGTIPTSTNSIGNTHSSFTSTLTYLRSTYTSPIISTMTSDHNSSSTTTTDNTDPNCVDRSDKCDEYEKYCKIERMIETMKTYCPMKCGFCEHQTTIQETPSSTYGNTHTSTSNTDKVSRTSTSHTTKTTDQEKPTSQHNTHETSTVISDCQDISDQCGSYRTYCDEPKMKSTMHQYCKYTCRFCEEITISTTTDISTNTTPQETTIQQKTSITQKTKPSISTPDCQDKSDQCDSYRTYCDEPKMKSTMHQYCKYTCRFCDQITKSSTIYQSSISTEPTNTTTKSRESPTTQHTTITTNISKSSTTKSDCQDRSDQCDSYRRYCNENKMKSTMVQYCKYTCNFCDPIIRPSSIHTTNSSSDATTTTSSHETSTSEHTTPITHNTKPSVLVCQDKSDKCNSYMKYCKEMRMKDTMIQYCKKTCRFCDSVNDTTSIITHSTKNSDTTSRSHQTTTPDKNNSTTKSIHQTTISDCQDESDQCDRYINYCQESRMKITMEQYCKYSCGFCETITSYSNAPSTNRNNETTKSNEITSSVTTIATTESKVPTTSIPQCQNKSDQCDSYTRYCEEPRMKATMMKYCQYTCNFCDCMENENEIFEVVIDRVVLEIICSNAKSNGYCNYSTIKEKCCKNC